MKVIIISLAMDVTDFSTIQAIIVDFDQSFQVASHNHKLAVGLVHPAKHFLVISTRVHDKADVQSRKNPAGRSNGALNLSVLADKVSRFVREPVDITYPRY